MGLLEVSPFDISFKIYQTENVFHVSMSEVWENEKCEPQASVSSAISSSPKLSRVLPLDNSMETQGKRFLLFL